MYLPNYCLKDTKLSEIDTQRQMSAGSRYPHLYDYSGLIILAITQLPLRELEGINETVFAKHLESLGGKGTAVI